MSVYTYVGMGVIIPFDLSGSGKPNLSNVPFIENVCEYVGKKDHQEIYWSEVAEYLENRFEKIRFDYSVYSNEVFGLVIFAHRTVASFINKGLIVGLDPSLELEPEEVSQLTEAASLFGAEYNLQLCVSTSIIY